MSSIRARKDNGLLFFDFQFQGRRCREQTTLPDTKANRRKLQAVLDKIDAEKQLGVLDYRKYFPNSPKAALFDAPANDANAGGADAPTFEEFAEVWIRQREIEWRHSTRVSNVGAINGHLIPAFGEKKVSDITEDDILEFRAELAKLKGRNGNATLAPKTINHVMGVLRMVLSSACRRHQLPFPMQEIKRLRIPRQDIHPFTLDQVRKIIDTVRNDFKDYFTVRFFTGMRTGEIHGLKWKYVDFERRQILVRETYSKGRTEYTKTDGSQRDIDMSQPVFDALKRQQKLTRGRSEYVFCTRSKTPLDAKNVTNRVWYPLLRYLELEARRPYQCRHTCATLWLASGENPEWISRQLGHANTEMLFRVYSRYVPNLTRRDGSAFERLIADIRKKENSDDE